jgi:PTH1 family peptidyl-tRNA hydrolase
VFLVVGLGNPGARYAETRHNVGFRVADRLAERFDPRGVWKDRFEGKLMDFNRRGERVAVLKPMTYMNESGRSAGAAARFFKVDADRILVLHDELDVSFGELRLKLGGGDAGHKGIRSIISHLGTADYVRVRLGVGRPPPEFAGDAVDFVLQGFAVAERPAVEQLVEKAVDAVELAMERGLAAAMNVVNQRGKT